MHRADRASARTLKQEPWPRRGGAEPVRSASKRYCFGVSRTLPPVIPATIFGLQALLLQRDYLADLRADNIAGNHQFHAPILLAALRGVVGSHRLSFAETLGRHRGGGHTLLGQIVADRLAAMLGKLLVVVVATDAIGVTFDVELEAGMTGDDAGHFGQLFARRGSQC